MTNTDLFRKTVEKRGLKYRFLAETIGITTQGLQNKIENRTEFKAGEIIKLSEVMHLSNEEKDAIFFSRGSD